MSNIIDVINTEEVIGRKMIIGGDNIKQMAILSGVSKLFNRIVKNDMETHRNKYIKMQILKKIDIIITNKMYSMIKKHKISCKPQPLQLWFFSNKIRLFSCINLLLRLFSCIFVS